MSENPNNLASIFRQHRVQALEIGYTNRNLQQVPELQDTEFEAIATRAIGLEQEQQIAGLRELDHSPYEELAANHLAAESRVTEAQSELARATEGRTAEHERYEALIERLGAIAPLGRSEAETLATQRIKNLESARIQQAQENLVAAQSAAAEFAAVYTEELSTPWPLPMAIGQKAVQDEVETEAIIDEIPIDPVLRESDRAKFRAFAERHVDEPQASQFISYYLGENHGRVVTVDELVNFLYGNVEREGVNLRTRITTMLGPMVQGFRIKRILAETDGGYELQYGWRQNINTRTKKRTGPARRIYRAVKREDIDALPKEIITERAFDRFEEMDQDVTEPTKPEGLTLPYQSIAQEVPKETEGEFQIVPFEDVVITESGTTDPASAEKQTVRKIEWQKELRDAIGMAIDALEIDNLMIEEDLTMDVASNRSSSKKFGTLEALQRLVDAKVIRVGYSNLERRKKYPLTPEDRVIMWIFNTNSRAFTEPSRRTEAKKIVKQAVASYFEKQKQANQ